MGTPQHNLVDLLGEVMALPSAEREPRLRAALSGDPARLAEAMSLLLAAERAGGFMGRPTIEKPSPGTAPTFGIPLESAAADAPTFRSKSLAEQPGMMIGRYKLLQQIGEGGFGVVFMAEQREPVYRQVALKIIKLGMDTSAVVARFEQERQALAMMDHPCIARVHDAGATDSGRPYFVMELVRGDPIVLHCNRQGLSTRERLELFAQVCRAVQHAHTKGVIHRDIKPANVLVTMVDGKPVPKVIDFGIAKATYGRLTDKTLFTEFRQLIGTPEYMSPEQADNSGVDIDARTDVYSLGVLLYELLTGVTPLDSRQLRSAAWGEMQRMIREVDPPRPSTRVMTVGRSPQSEEMGRATGRPTGSSIGTGEPKRIAAAIRGDIDWIVMRCLEKDRSRRYDTAHALAADLERHLRGEPVVAAPPSALYKAAKFARRHRVAVAVASLVVILVLGGMVGTTLGLVRARSAELMARQQAHIASAAAEKAQAEAARADAQAAEARDSAKLAQAVNDLMASMITRADRAKVGGRTDVSVREVMDAAAADIEAGVTSRDPRVDAMLAKTIGETYWQLNIMDKAEKMLRMHSSLTKQHFGDKSLEHASSALYLGGLLKKRGDLSAAREQYAYARSLAGSVGERGVEVAASATLNECVIAAESGELEKAEADLRGVLEALKAAGKGTGPIAITATGNLAAMLFQRGKIEEAEAVYRSSLAMLRAAGKEEDVVTALNNLAAIQNAKRDFAAAEKTAAEAVAAARRLHGDTHPRVANGLDAYSMLLLTRQEVDGALKAQREAVAIRRASHKPGHPELCTSLRRLGYVLIETPDLVEAEAVLREALEGSIAVLPPTDTEIVFTRTALASVLHAQGKNDQAEELARASLAGAAEFATKSPRSEWMRPAAACLLASILSQRASAAGSTGDGTGALIAEAETLLNEHSPRLIALRDGINQRMRVTGAARAMKHALAAREALHAVKPSAERESAVATARAALSAW